MKGYAVDAEAVVAALFAPLSTERVEVAAFAYFDPEWRLLGMRHARSAQPDLVALPVREVARDPLAFGAVAVVMAHNHPSGDPAPSRADLAATRRLARTLGDLGVELVDHLVLGGSARTSLRERGLL